MSQYTVTLIPGDGSGPEVVEAARRVLEATGVKFQWEVMEAGETALVKHGDLLPPLVLDSIKRNRVALKGPISTPVGKGFRSVNVALRKTLDLYVNLRPAMTFHGVRSPLLHVDLIIVRENTEDLYAGIEFNRGTTEMEKLRKFLDEEGFKVREDAACSMKIISWAGSVRVVRWAFQYAKALKRKKVTAVHKANIMKFTDGLFLEAARSVADEFPDIEFEDRIVDNMCMQLVQKPELYDVLVLPNLYGDIISDLCAGLVGGLGVAPGANLGDRYAVFEPVHGSAPKYAGQNKVNPIATMLSGVMMLRHLGEQDAATRLEKAIALVISEGKSVTYDMKPASDDPTAVGTSQVADAVIAKLNEVCVS